MTRQLRPSPVCLNCGHAAGTRFCPECGQENTDYRVSLRRLVGDLFDELFQLESRLWRTLWTLFRRPGLLTLEYNAGRRVRYTTPLRLYLLASVTYFFVSSIVPTRGEVNIDFGKPGELESAIQVPASGWRHTLLERLRPLRDDPAKAIQRTRQLLAQWVPRVMAVTVPSFALLTMLFFRRPQRFYVEHLVFALHLHAAAFFLLTITALVRGTGAVVSLALIVVYAASARRVFAQSWWRLAWKLPIVSQLYSILLGVALAVVLVFGLLFAS